MPSACFRGSTRASCSRKRPSASPIGSQPSHIFIDEGGTFIPATGWGVVCSLAIPHKEVGAARREINVSAETGLETAAS
jgi:hypothetical protein